MEKQRLTFTGFMKQVAEQLNEDGHRAASHVHGSALRRLLSFTKDKEVEFDDITPFFLKRFEEQLTLDGRRLNTVSTYMRALSATFNKAVEQGYVSPVPALFKYVFTGVCSQTKRALDATEVEPFLNPEGLQLPPELKEACICFALMFLFRGMPFIDLAHLRKCDFDGEKIVYSRHKTKQIIQVTVPPEAIPLMTAFCNTNEQSVYLFPILNALGEGYLTALRRLNERLERLAIILGLKKKVSSYTARHSWATIAFFNNVPIGVISRALGHTSIRTTEAYLAPLGYVKIDDANETVMDTVLPLRKKKTA